MMRWLCLDDQTHRLGGVVDIGCVKKVSIIKNLYALKVVAQEKAKEIYREITTIISRDEKVFSLTWGEAIDTYQEREYERYVGGVIDKEWLSKKISFLRNTWGGFVGLDTPVNKTDDADAEESSSEFAVTNFNGRRRSS